jgi:hypothetical protein
VTSTAAVLTVVALATMFSPDKPEYVKFHNWNGERTKQLQVASGEDCSALHKPTSSRLTIENITMERGDIMVRYHVKEHDGRWYYAKAFTDFNCK